MGDGETPQLREDLPLHVAARVKTSTPLAATASGQQGGICHRLSPSEKAPLTSGDLVIITHLLNDPRELQRGHCSLQLCSCPPASLLPWLWGYGGQAGLAAASRCPFVNKHLAAMVMLI